MRDHELLIQAQNLAIIRASVILIVFQLIRLTLFSSLNNNNIKGGLIFYLISRRHLMFVSLILLDTNNTKIKLLG